MPRYPGATWRPLDRNFTRRKTDKARVILHTSASATATSLHGWFNNPAAASSSHFHVADDGTIEQMIDTDHVSWASGEGNADSISIETQGDGTTPWTPAQLDALVRLVKWAHTAHGVPLMIMSSSKAGTKGVGWHRLGVDGYFPDLPSPLAGRLQRGGGERWSSARGKSCPGDDRIRQVPGIIEAAKATTAAAMNIPGLYRVTGAARLNVRTGPGAQYPILGSAPKGTVISGTGRTSGGWIEGATPYMRQRGQTGWFSGYELTEV